MGIFKKNIIRRLIAKIIELILLIILISSFCNTFANAPPGFEDFNTNIIEYADAYYNGSYIGKVKLDYNIDIITILNPKFLVDKLNNINDFNKVQIINALKKI